MIILEKKMSCKEIADLLEGKLIGENQWIDRVASLKNGCEAAIGFIDNAQFLEEAKSSHLSALLVAEHYPECPQTQIVVKSVRQSWRVLTEHFLDSQLKNRFKPMIADSAIIHRSAKIGNNVHIGEGVVIEEGANIADNVIIESLTTIGYQVSIGKNTHIGSGTRIIEGAKVGERCRILSNAVIGERGFGNVFEDGVWKAIPQLGSVIIGDDVEIGAGTMIDRGAIDDTIIGNGVKLDNLIQIAHNVVIGDHTAIAGCTVIAGSVTFGKYCIVGGACVFNGHISICDGAQFTGHSSISKSITEPGAYSSGIPVMPVKKWHRFVAKLRMLGK